MKSINEEAEKFLTPNVENEVFNYNLNGKLVCEKDMVVARKTVSSLRKEPLYWVLSNGSRLYDVQNSENNYNRINHWKLTPVKEKTFNLYMKFLTSKKKTFLTNAEREI